ncbi:phage antirepressor KilAC domain-containing protein [Paenibacillus sp. PDC88]|uniref:phage antirepressor KilAC domain-containing protein n=1 Tax=Paenibacillus sp. PDC88 TaxID=1884375 RepID=UPI00089D51D3|nr:phage antirepressor [Paenibacillus sp. PDC88]SDX04534.1 Prophage antirepressor [Paenibacillus sp. PDC88]
MNKQIQQFMYGHFQLRSFVIENEPWFVAKDVCNVLDISNSRDALNRLDEDEKGVVSTDTLGGTQQLATVNEPGLYTLILGSRKPEAKQFKRWITHEVIPSIRKHGAYMTTETLEKAILNPDFLINLASELKKEQEKSRALEQQIQQVKPKVLFAEAVEGSSNSILIGQLATILKQNGVNIGQNRLFDRLREEGFLCKAGDRKNLPTQRAMDMDLFEVQERTFSGSSETKVKFTTRVTGRGQIYFLNKFKGDIA